MQVMNQEQYKVYRKKLRDDGFPAHETTSHIPNEKTFKILENRIGRMPWELLKIERRQQGARL